MGCFNGTDGVTQIPIEEDDLVRLIPLASSMFRLEAGGSVDTVESYFKPFAIPLRGKYDNYGGIKVIENGVSQGLVSYFKDLYKRKCLIFSERAQIDSRYLVNENFTTTALLKWIQSGLVLNREELEGQLHKERRPDEPFNFLGKKTSKFGYMLVLEKVYQGCIQAFGERVSSWNGQKKTQKQLADDRLKEMWDDFLKHRPKRDPSKPIDLEETLKNVPEDLAKSMREIFSLKREYLFSKFKLGLIGDFIPYDATVEKLLFEQKDEQAFQICSDWQEFLLFNTFMLCTSKPWLVYPSSGQEPNYKLFQKLAKIIEQNA